MNKSKKSITAVAVLSAFVSWADTATFTMPDGVTNTVDEAISAGRLSGVADYQGLLAADDLVVAGTGELVLDKDLKTAGYAGEIHVQAGATLVLSSVGALGDTTHGTFVADGATLAVNPDCAEAKALSFSNEPLTFAGQGADGMGALQVRTVANSPAQRAGCWGGTLMTMTGDATVSVRGEGSSMYDFPCQSGNSLDMNGHTLTIMTDGTKQKTIPVRFRMKNPGHVVVSNSVYLSINDTARLAGGPENTLTIGAGSTIDFFGCGTDDATQADTKWTLILASELPNAFVSTSGGGCWGGPIRRTGGTQTSVRFASESKTDAVRLSLPGGFTSTTPVAFNNATAAGKGYLGECQLFLPSAANAFPLGLTMKGVDLFLDAAALNPTDGTLTLNDALLTLTSADADYHLPSVTFNRDGEQTLGADCTFGDLTVRCGDVKLKAPVDRHWNAGLWKGTNQAYTAWAKGDCPANGLLGFGGRLCWTNEVTLGPELAMKATARNYGKVTVVTYSGYVWNRDTSVESRVLTCYYGVTSLCQVYVYNGSKWNSLGRQGADGTIKAGIWLKQGAWPIEIRMVTISADGSFGPNGAIPSDYGILYNWGSATCESTDPKDYQPLMDPGDGSLLTLTVPDTPEYEALEAKATAARQFAESVTVDGSLDLGSANLSTLTLSGTGTVVNEPLTYATGAKLTVTDALALRKDDLLSGKGLSVQGKLAFGANAKVTLDKLDGVRNGTYEILASTEPIEGDLALGALPEARFSLRFSDDRKTLYMDVCRGLAVILK